MNAIFTKYLFKQSSTDVLSDRAPQARQTLRRQGGVASRAELQAALGASQPTVSRLLKLHIQTGQPPKVGAARSARYVLPRAVPTVGAEVRVMRVWVARPPLATHSGYVAGVGAGADAGRKLLGLCSG